MSSKTQKTTEEVLKAEAEAKVRREMDVKVQEWLGELRGD
jgi:hypothetical protein